MPSSTLKISIAQTCPANGSLKFSSRGSASPEFDVFANIRRNLSIIAKSVKDASENGSELVVFPEYFTQGSLDGRAVSSSMMVHCYVSFIDIIPTQYLAQPAHHILQELRILAIRHNIAIAGTIVEPDCLCPQPPTSPFSTSPSNRATWAKKIRHSHPHAFGQDHSPSHANRATDEKDLPKEDAHTARCQKLLNVAYFVEGGTGEIIGRYVKKNLWISERYAGFTEHSSAAESDLRR